ESLLGPRKERAGLAPAGAGGVTRPRRAAVPSRALRRSSSHRSGAARRLRRPGGARTRRGPRRLERIVAAIDVHVSTAARARALQVGSTCPVDPRAENITSKQPPIIETLCERRSAE